MADDDRIPCRVCGRKFAAEPLSRHQKVCKNAQKPRKVFDSSKQRATADLSVKQIKQAQRKDVGPPKTHWREKHQDFINAIRSSKGVSAAINSGGPLPPPPPPSINPDYIQCPYCSRRFNAKAAERHIGFCKEQSMRLPKGKADPAAKAKQSTRLNYQAPKPVSKAAPTGRGGASGRGAAMPGSRAPGATRGRGGGIPAGRYNSTQEDDFSPFGQGVDSAASVFDTSPVPSSRSGYSSHNSYSNRHPPRGKLQQTRGLAKASHSNSYSNSNHYQQQKKTPPASKKYPPASSRYTEEENSYDAYYADSYADPDQSEKHNMNNFPDHFNKRYKTNPNTNSPVPSYTKNKPPTHFQYLNNIENNGPYDEEDDMYLYSNSNNASPPASLYGRSKQSSKASHASNPHRDTHGYPNSEFGPQAGSGPRSKLLMSYCQECGAKYPMAEAKFCCECGMRRPEISHGETGGVGGGGVRYSRLKH